MGFCLYRQQITAREDYMSPVVFIIHASLPSDSSTSEEGSEDAVGTRRVDSLILRCEQQDPEILQQLHNALFVSDKQVMEAALHKLLDGRFSEYPVTKEQIEGFMAEHQSWEIISGFYTIERDSSFDPQPIAS
jgi:hypothetical protein